jgi:putative membrane protein
MMRQAILAGAVTIGLAAVPVFAADEAWVMKIAKGGIAEVELGKLAAEKASSDAVKQFGQRMVDDHGKPTTN